MKNISQIITLSLISITFNANAFTDEFLGRMSSTSTEANSYQGGGRQFHSLGGGSIRWPSRTDHLMSITPPRISSGCGGIDAYLGGVSFLDEEYLVQKAEAIIANAPFIAFDIAMKNMSAQLSESFGKAEAMINMLNNITLDDCSIAKGIVTTPVSDYSSNLKSMYDEAVRQVQVAGNNAKNNLAAKDLADTAPANETFAGCTDPGYRRMMSTSGSLLAKLNDPQIFPTALIDANRLPAIRAHFGDIFIQYQNGEVGIPNIVNQAPCPNVNNYEQTWNQHFVERRYYTRGADASNECTAVPSDIQAVVGTMIDKMRDGTFNQTATLQENGIVVLTKLPLFSLFNAKTIYFTGYEKDTLQDTTETVLPTFFIQNMWRQNAEEYLTSLIQLKMRIAKVSKTETCPAEAAVSMSAHIEEKIKDLKTYISYQREFIRAADEDYGTAIKAYQEYVFTAYRVMQNRIKEEMAKAQ